MNYLPECSTDICHFTQSPYFPSPTFSIHISTALVNSFLLNSPWILPVHAPQLHESHVSNAEIWSWYTPAKAKQTFKPARQSKLFFWERRPFLSICPNSYILFPVFLLWNFNQSIMNYLQFLKGIRPYFLFSLCICSFPTAVMLIMNQWIVYKNTILGMFHLYITHHCYS